MMTAVEAYLALRRTAGFAMCNVEYLLRSFARFAAARGEQHVRATTLIDWASQGRSLAQRHARYQAVCKFASQLRLEDPSHELLPPNYFGYKKTRRIPHIYSPAEVDRLMLAASRLTPRGSLRPQTYATLIGLLASTGMRVSEALGLRVGDVTSEGLLIRKTKFQKTRMVPLHDTSVAALGSYLERRLSMHPGGDHVFVGSNGQPLTYTAVYPVFGRLLKAADVPGSQGHRPRLHELRHTFAVRALESAPAGRQRIGQHMVALATYLGHVNIDATYWYLQTTAELLVDIAAAGERFLTGEQP
ncbi:MAG: tyrosine-type recombinase/integrase [Sulfuritalea sp.]|nr:tyrosine-type recombinase/integrase [Sulfuritalea sp.]